MKKYPIRVLQVALSFFFLVCSLPLVAQVDRKVPEKLWTELATAKHGQVDEFVIQLSDSSVWGKHIVKLPGTTLIYGYPSASVYVLKTSYTMLRDQVLPLPQVLFADRLRQPVEEVAVSNLDLSVNRISALHHLYPGINGAEQHVSIKEQRPDTADIDFKGRYRHNPLASNTLSAHATLMGTIVAGAGNSYYEGKGVAPAAQLSSVSFTNLLPEPDSYYQQNTVNVQNHSYGTGIENFYGADARAYDINTGLFPSLVHVFSVGNSGTSIPANGSYNGIAGYANSTGSFKMAKNIITVGHTDSLGNVQPLSSRGPAHDGRLMPQLVAFGEDGSSGAAALVSGASLVLQHSFRNLYGTQPRSDLVRALLYSAAEDVGPAGIDYISGFGAMNALKAVRLMEVGQFTTGLVSQGAEHVVTIDVPLNTAQLKLTLAWNDVAANANVARALINDLDLELEETGSGTIYQPWVLSSFPHIDSLSKLPVRRRDSLNNVEQVVINLPPPGQYIIRVKGRVIQTASQSFSLAWSIDTTGKFEWIYPTGSDNIFPGRSNTLRWNSTLSATPAAIEISYDNGQNWQVLTSSVNLPGNYFRWNTPAFTTTAKLRLVHLSGTWASDLFTISDRIDLQVGFHCADSFSLHWNRLPGVGQYEIYSLGEKYMQPVGQVNDSFFVFQKSQHPSFHYAIAPVINGMQGLRSYTYDYRSQGTGCYIRSFFAIKNADSVQLQLLLGTVYGVQSITWEKKINNVFAGLSTMQPVAMVSLSHADRAPVKGTNTYRARIALTNGGIIYTGEESVFYQAGSSFVVFPNPLPGGQSIRIMNAEILPARLRIFNMEGREVFKTLVDSPVYDLPFVFPSSGMYFFELIKADGIRETVKILVL